MSSSVSKMTLGMGIPSGVLSLLALILAIVTFLYVDNNFTSDQVNTLKSWTNLMDFTADNYLTTAGFTDNSGFSSDVTGKTVILSDSSTIGSIKITDALLSNNNQNQLTPAGVTIDDFKVTNMTIDTLNTTSIDSGNWGGQVITSTKGGLGSGTITPYAVLVGGDSVTPGTSGSYLIAQGAGVLPTYFSLPTYANGSFNGNFSNLFGLAWSMAVPPLCFYTLVDNVYAVSGKVSLTAIGSSPIIGPRVTFDLIGGPVGPTVVKGIWTLTNLTQGTNIPMEMNLTNCAALEASLSGITASDVIQFSFTIAYTV